jgi:hypothetical protein
MEHFWVQPTLWAFLIQALVQALVVPFSYIAYRWARVPARREQVTDSLTRLGITRIDELDRAFGEYTLKNYFWPLCFATLVTVAAFALSHPYLVQLGVMAGWIEEVIDIFGEGALFPRPILTARFFMWASLGAWVYSIHLIFHRFLAYDLTPSVYVFVFNRYVLAMIVSTIVGVGVGTFSTATGVPFDVNLATVSIISFFIGFFPEQGLDWITAIAQKSLKLQRGIARETSLAEIEGLSIWHQGRLKQESIENVQNLATADIPALVVSTSFTVEQIVDWVDQAILLTYASQDQFVALEKVGVRCASTVLTAGGDGKWLSQVVNATDLNKDGLRVLHKALQSAFNLKLISHFRQQTGMEAAKKSKTATHQRPRTSPNAMVLPREQEALMFESEEE